MFMVYLVKPLGCPLSPVMIGNANAQAFSRAGARSPDNTLT
jgi:hypothetical protein